MGALASRALLGFGTGLFFAAAMVYAKSKLEGPRTTYFFGIFSGMISFPAALAPTLAETYFNDYGAHYLFVVLSIPGFVGVFISSLLTKDVTIKEDLNQRPVTYLALLRISHGPCSYFDCHCCWTTVGFYVVFYGAFIEE